MNLPAAFLALANFDAPLFSGLFGMIPVVLTVAGPALHAYAPFHRHRIEERVKECEMTETEARWHLIILRVTVPALTLLGLVLLLLKASEMFL